MKKVLFSILLNIGSLSYAANSEQINYDLEGFMAILKQTAIDNGFDSNNDEALIPTVFFYLLLGGTEENSYINFADYQEHATVLLSNYMQVNPGLKKDLSSRVFIRSALIAVLISVKYAEEKSVYLIDLINGINNFCPHLFHMQELKMAEKHFLTALKWNIAHPKNLRTHTHIF